MCIIYFAIPGIVLLKKSITPKGGEGGRWLGKKPRFCPSALVQIKGVKEEGDMRRTPLGEGLNIHPGRTVGFVHTQFASTHVYPLSQSRVLSTPFLNGSPSLLVIQTPNAIVEWNS